MLIILFTAIFSLSVGEHSKSLFVLSKYGGHLGFFEGSFFWPRSETWIDRLMVEYAEACLASEC